MQFSKTLVPSWEINKGGNPHDIYNYVLAKYVTHDPATMKHTLVYVSNDYPVLKTVALFFWPVTWLIARGLLRRRGRPPNDLEYYRSPRCRFSGIRRGIGEWCRLRLAAPAHSDLLTTSKSTMADAPEGFVDPISSFWARNFLAKLAHPSELRWNSSKNQPAIIYYNYILCTNYMTLYT